MAAISQGRCRGIGTLIPAGNCCLGDRAASDLAAAINRDTDGIRIDAGIVIRNFPFDRRLVVDNQRTGRRVSDRDDRRRFLFDLKLQRCSQCGIRIILGCHIPGLVRGFNRHWVIMSVIVIVG